MQLIVKNHANESGHWYTREGKPAYTIVGKNGKERNTTLRDAREHNLVPSVTTIIRCAASPGLDRWKQEQVLLSALTLPRRDGEPEQDYLSRVMEDSRAAGKAAAEAGERIHAAVENHYKGRQYDSKYAAHVRGVVGAIGPDMDAEVAFAHPLGFGGKVDLSSETHIWDVKTKDFSDPATVRAYDEHLMQVAAYRVGLDYLGADCGNVFVSRTTPGLVHLVEWSPPDLVRGWEMFLSLLRFWQTKNGVA